MWEIFVGAALHRAGFLAWASCSDPANVMIPVLKYVLFGGVSHQSQSYYLFMGGPRLRVHVSRNNPG
jgi:hypothetical protein